MSAAVSLGHLAGGAAFVSLEAMLCSPAFFALTTASPLQRAICRVADGKPLAELGRDPAVVRAFGGIVPMLGERPKEVAILTGVRSGKSLFAGAFGVSCALRCDVSRLGPGEVPRVSIVSLTKDLADVVYGHITGRILESPILKGLLLKDPTSDTVTLRHRTGRPVEIRVVAGSRAGASLTARWMPACIFDEFPRMVGEDEGVVNWDDSRRAVLERILPGGGIAHIGSPWAPFGPAFSMVQEHFGAPSKRLVVVRAPAYDMNPQFWTPARVEGARENPDVFQTDVLGEFSSPEEAFFLADLLAAASRPDAEDIPREPGCIYVAAMDPATRGNGWTLTIWTRKGRRKICVAAREWRGSRKEPLSPKAVLAEAAQLLAAYGVTSVDTDQHLGDALVDLARDTRISDGTPYPISLFQWTLSDRERTDRYMAVRTRLEAGELELPGIGRMRTDLLRVKKRATQTGVTIVLPLTSDGRHCDFAPSVMLGVSRCIEDEKPMPSKSDDPEAARMRKRAEKRFGKRGLNDW